MYMYFQLLASFIEGYATVSSKNVIVKEAINFTYNPISFLFQDIRHELNGVEIDRNRNVGITTTMKSYISMNEGESKTAASWGWNENGIKLKDGRFNFNIPLSKILGFAEDYEKIILNCKHELILNRSSSNLNSVLLK